MATIKDIQFKIDNSWNNLLDYIYPVNSIYVSIGSTSPATLFGGTWAELKTGVLRAAGANGTGGSDSFTVAWNNLPQHVHWTAITTGGPSNNTSGTPSNNTSGTPSNNATGGVGAHTHKLDMHGSPATLGGGWGLGNIQSESRKSSSEYTESTGAHTHTLNSHTHTLASHTHSLSSHTHTGSAWSNTGQQTSSGNALKATPDSISRLPAYQNVYVWKRTA